MKKVVILLILLILVLFCFCNKEGYTSGNNIVVYYINLDHRDDRRREIIGEIQKLGGVPSIRIPGVYEKDRGHLGCSKSHIKALETFINSGSDKCIILEDDFQFINDPKQLDLPSSTFDVVMLSGSGGTVEPSSYTGLQRINNVQTTAGYMVSKQFAPTLLQNFKDGCKLLEQDYNNHGTHAIDQYWKRLQPISNWFVFDPKLGMQRESFSDIQGGIVDYGV